ncbi:hypothetical protein MNBD_GAMMA11-626 [hydrothermal vent metagenome]|uniref:Uncharacterized protein n=1 Tax=hydrothermal vent metagenome TaxID=652676 RepID=A0A3B0WS92_9ZZZZ
MSGEFDICHVLQLLSESLNRVAGNLSAQG